MPPGTHFALYMHHWWETEKRENEFSVIPARHRSRSGEAGGSVVNSKKHEKGKPPERVGRKATGLSSDLAG